MLNYPNRNPFGVTPMFGKKEIKPAQPQAPADYARPVKNVCLLDNDFVARQSTGQKALVKYRVKHCLGRYCGLDNPS